MAFRTICRGRSVPVFYIWGISMLCLTAYDLYAFTVPEYASRVAREGLLFSPLALGWIVLLFFFRAALSADLPAKHRRLMIGLCVATAPKAIGVLLLFTGIY